jgi:hypothetical protein
MFGRYATDVADKPATKEMNNNKMYEKLRQMNINLAVLLLTF